MIQLFEIKFFPGYLREGFFKKRLPNLYPGNKILLDLMQGYFKRTEKFRIKLRNKLALGVKAVGRG